VVPDPPWQPTRPQVRPGIDGSEDTLRDIRQADQDRDDAHVRLDQFAADCRAAVADAPPLRPYVKSWPCRRGPSAVQQAIGEPRRAEVQVLHRSADLTILNVIWGPKMTIMPHNHEMWAVVGVYTGREDNILWRRLPGEAGGRIEAAGAKALSERDAFSLGRDIIHSVTNPIGRLTGAIHVYGGDFFGVPRSEWDPERLTEQPYDVQRAMQLFEDSNRSSSDASDP